MGTAVVEIRRAGDGDLAAILALYAECGLAGERPVSAAEARDIFHRTNRYPSYRFWVAEQSGTVVATYALLIVDNMAHSGRPFAIVEQVAVDPRRQGQGVGQLMMRHAMDEAQTAGCYKLMLSSHVARASAHAFYDKLGFERHGYGFVVPLPEPRSPDGD